MNSKFCCVMFFFTCDIFSGCITWYVMVSRIFGPCIRVVYFEYYMLYEF